MKISISYVAGALATLSFALSVHTASAQSLTPQERQFVNLVRNEEFEKANFYVTQGLVDPKNLSTGKELPAYFYPDPSCRSQGYCMPNLEVTQFLASAFDLNKPIRGTTRPASYICHGGGALLTSEFALTQKWELNFADESGLSPFHYCARHRPYESDHKQMVRMTTIMTNLLKGGADINARTEKKWDYANKGATPLMLAVANWYPDVYGYSTIIDFLFANGATADVIDDEGYGVVNYLAYPSRSRHYEKTTAMLKLLHKHGVDIMHKDPKKNESFFDHAMRVGDVDFAMEIMQISKS